MEVQEKKSFGFGFEKHSFSWLVFSETIFLSLSMAFVAL